MWTKHQQTEKPQCRLTQKTPGEECSTCYDREGARTCWSCAWIPIEREGSMQKSVLYSWLGFSWPNAGAGEAEIFITYPIHCSNANAGLRVFSTNCTKEGHCCELQRGMIRVAQIDAWNAMFVTCWTKKEKRRANRQKLYANTYRSMHTVASKQLLPSVRGFVERCLAEKSEVLGPRECTAVVEIQWKRRKYLQWSRRCLLKRVYDDIGIDHDCYLVKMESSGDVQNLRIDT